MIWSLFAANGEIWTHLFWVVVFWGSIPVGLILIFWLAAVLDDNAYGPLHSAELKAEWNAEHKH